MKIRITIPSLIAVAIASFAMIALPNVAASKSKSGLRSFHGKVVSVTEANDGFTIRRANDSTVDFTVGENTVYKHLGGGIARLVPGLAVEVKAKGPAGDTPRFARKVEADGADAKSNGGHKVGNHGTADDKGGSAGGHGADDPAGDDHGSGGHGADDPAGDDHGSGGHGADDPAGDDKGGTSTGSDDPAGDDKGGKSGKGGKGADDTGGGHGGRGGDD